MQILCESKGVCFINNSNNRYFIEHPEWFKDETHLNSDGADEYTRFFIKQLKEKKLCYIN
jgi:hypothetical protein